MSPESVDDRDNSKAAIKERLGENYMKRKTPDEMKEFGDLPTWVRTAAVCKYLMGMTWKDVASKVNRSPKTVQGYTSSPAFKRWKSELEEASSDPKLMAELVLRSNALGVTLEYLAAFQQAIDDSDYKETGIMARDLLDRIGVTKKSEKGPSGGMTINVTLPGGASLEPVMVETEYKQLESEDPDYEVVDDDD